MQPWDLVPCLDNLPYPEDEISIQLQWSLLTNFIFCIWSNRAS